MDLKRVLTFFIGLPIVMCILIFSNKFIIDGIMTIIALISMYEYIKCVSTKGNKAIKWISYLSVLSIAFLHVIPTDIYLAGIPYVIPSLLVVLFLHVIVTDMKITFEDISYTLLGILYIVGFISFIPLVYGIEGNISGKVLIWFIFLATWGSDTFAYLVGKRIGKTKFSKVSPKKSVEGCVAGLLAAIILVLGYAFVLNYFFNFTISYLSIGIIGCVLGAIGQVGDFAASVIKRYFGIKDYSEIFPGHGGMIDRIDSVMFVAPFAYLLLTMFIV